MRERRGDKGKRYVKQATALWMWMLLVLGLPGLSVEGIDVASFPQTPPLTSQAAVLMDADTGQLLYGVNQHEKLPPASLTKIMTCLLAQEYGNYGEMAAVTEEALADVGGSTVLALTPGEEVSLDDLLYGMMARSANDAANVLGIHIGGSLEGFVDMMNDTAQALGAVDTQFQNPSGLPDDDHYTTAYDLALITRAAYAYPEFRTYAGTREVTLPATNMAGERVVTNRNQVYASDTPYEGAFLGKTGWTRAAGQCLMTMAQRDGVTLICVVLGNHGGMGGQTTDTIALLDYGFTYFQRVELPQERFPNQQISYVDANGTVRLGELVYPNETIPVLLAQGVSPSVLTLHTVAPQMVRAQDMGALRLELRLPEVAGEVMYTLAGSFPLEVRPLVLPAVATEEKPPFDWSGLFTALGKAGGILLGMLLLCLLGIRQYRYRLYRKILNVQNPYVYWDDDAVFHFHCFRPTAEDMEEMRESYRRKPKLLGVGWDDVQLVVGSLRKGVLGKLPVKKKTVKQKPHKLTSEEKRQLEALGGSMDNYMERLAQGYTVSEIVEKHRKAEAERKRLWELGAQRQKDGIGRRENRARSPFDRRA